MDQAAAERLMRALFHEGTDTPNTRDVLLGLFAPDFICHGPPGINHSHRDGPEPVERCMFGGAFAGLIFSVSGVEATDDRIVARFSGTGRLVAEFNGVPPSPAPRTVEGTATFRTVGDRLAEGWGVVSWR
jgi:hypothetical protein